mmetsp:Transcript_19829/g.41025  ORF Transcript_19829/g.41025 Transcript_19829/m.41025 type:complete len:174 (+) Transcript_19829:408-929(+)
MRLGEKTLPRNNSDRKNNKNNSSSNSNKYKTVDVGGKGVLDLDDNNGNGVTRNGDSDIVSAMIEQGEDLQTTRLSNNVNFDNKGILWYHRGGNKRGFKSNNNNNNRWLEQLRDSVWVDGVIYREPWQENSLYEDWQAVTRDMKNFCKGILFLWIVRRIVIRLLRTRYRSNSIQ